MKLASTGKSKPVRVRVTEKSAAKAVFDSFRHPLRPLQRWAVACFMKWKFPRRDAERIADSLVQTTLGIDSHGIARLGHIFATHPRAQSSRGQSCG